MKNFKVLTILLCVLLLVSCQRKKSSVKTHSAHNKPDVSSTQGPVKQVGFGQEMELPLETFNGQTLLPSDLVSDTVTIETKLGEATVFVASTVENPDLESLYIVFYPIEDEEKAYIVSGEQDLPAGSITDIHSSQDDNGDLHFLFTKESELFYLDFEDELENEDEEISVVAKPIVSGLPYIVSFSSDEGLADSIDIMASGLSQSSLFSTVVQIFLGDDCQGVEILKRVVSSNDEGPNYLIEDVPMVEGLHNYSLKRTVSGISHCAQISRNYKRLVYKSLPEFLDVKDHPFTQVVVRAKEIENASIGLKYILELGDRTYDFNSDLKAFVQDLGPAKKYDFIIRVCERNDPSVCLNSPLATYTTKDPLSDFFEEPSFTLKKDAQTPFYGLYVGFAKTLYAELKNKQEGARYIFYKDSCEGKVLNDSAKILVEENKVNTYYVKVLLDGQTKCSKGISYRHLGGEFDSFDMKASEITLTQARLSWGSFKGIKNFILRSNGIILARPQTNLFTLTDLRPESPYEIELLAEDFDSHLSNVIGIVRFNTLEYLKPTMDIFPPLNSSPTNILGGYKKGVADTIDIKILGLSSYELEEVRLYSGSGCKGSPLYILNKLGGEIEKIFASVDALSGPWSVERRLKDVSRCSDELLTYEQIVYKTENRPLLEALSMRSLKVSLVPVREEEASMISYQVKQRKVGENVEGTWVALKGAEEIIDNLKVGTSYTVVSRICDKFGICSKETLASEAVSTFLNPCKDLKGGEYVYIPRLDSEEIKVSDDVKKRAEDFASVSEKGFCVMKYDAKKQDGFPISQSSLLPWTRINQMEALAACTSLGSDYRLLTNAEWMTLALNIEAQKSNWNKEGSKMNKGISSDVSTFDARWDCVADATSCGLDEEGFHENRRTFFIDNDTDYPDNIIWDIAGNVYNWIIWDTVDLILKGTDTPGTENGYNDLGYYLKATEKVKILEILPQAAKLNTFTPAIITKANFGQYVRSATLPTVAPKRGGGYRSGTVAGVFSLSLYRSGEEVGSDVGFRCMKEL